MPQPNSCDGRSMARGVEEEMNLEKYEQSSGLFCSIKSRNLTCAHMHATWLVDMLHIFLEYLAMILSMNPIFAKKQT